MQWEDSVGNVACNYFPGEDWPNGAGSTGGNGIKSPCIIPRDYYLDPSFLSNNPRPTFAAINCASLPYSSAVNLGVVPRGFVEPTDDGSKLVFRFSGTWRQTWTVWDVEIAVEVPTIPQAVFPPPPPLPLLRPVSTWTLFTKEEDIPIPAPHSDVPGRLPGGVDFRTEFHEPPAQEEVFLFSTIVEAPPRPVEGKSFRTEFHEPPAVEARLFSTPLPALPRKGGISVWSEFREPPTAPPIPDVSFALSPGPPRRRIESPPQSVFTTVGVDPPAARVRRGRYDDFGLYTRDV